jgi:hypothetical protein
MNAVSPAPVTTFADGTGAADESVDEWRTASLLFD